MAKKQKQNKYTFFKGNDEYGNGGHSAVLELEQKCRQNYINKFYNIWMSKFKWSGLDAEIKDQQENFIMRKFWSDGTVAGRKVPGLDVMAYMPYAGMEYDMYDFPSKVTLVNLRGVSQVLVPQTPQVVGKDVVIGWCQPNHKPIEAVVRYYVDRMVQVDMVINTNLNLMKMPFLIGVNEIDKDKMKNIVDRILANEVVIFASLEELNKVQALATQTPYIVDKLVAHKRGLEQALMTYMGVDNNGSENLEQTHVSVDAVNANNDVINDYGYAIESEIKKWIEQMNRVFGRNISIEATSKPVSSVKEDNNGGVENEETNNQMVFYLKRNCGTL